MEILKVFALLMLSYGLVSSETSTTATDPDPPTSAPTTALPGNSAAPVTEAPKPTGGNAGGSPTTAQAPTITTEDPITAGESVRDDIIAVCPTINTVCKTQMDAVQDAIDAKNKTALCSDFKTFLACAQEKCEKSVQNFQTGIDDANKFVSTHCSSAVLTQGSMALAITLAWLSAYISGKL